MKKLLCASLLLLTGCQKPAEKQFYQQFSYNAGFDTFECRVIWIYDQLDEIKDANYEEIMGYYIVSTSDLKDDLQVGYFSN